MTETRGRPVLSRPRVKGWAASLLFLILAVVCEFLLVYSFLLLGVSDKNVLTILQFPGTNVALAISPLFHLLPLAVLIALISSWIYLTGTYAHQFAIMEKRKPASAFSRREIEKRRLKSLRKLSRGINRRFQRIGRSMKAAFLKVPGIAGLSTRLSIARSSVRSALTVFAIFISVSLLLCIIVYPDLIRDIVVGFYQTDSSRVNFVVGIGDGLQGIGTALPPISSLGTAIVNGLWTAAPGFRQSLTGVGASLTSGVVNYDSAGKYILSQNAATLSVVAIALLYGRYSSVRRPRRR